MSKDTKDAQPDHLGDDESILVPASADCGCGPCAPSWARRFATPKLFVVHGGLMFGLNIMSAIYTGGVLSSIEKSFQISSSTVGALIVVDDISSFSLMFFVSYFGHASHRPRIISCAGIRFYHILTSL